MMMTIRSKSGTSDWGMAVGIGGGGRVGRVGRTCVEVTLGKGLTDGTTVGGALVVQETNKTRNRIFRYKRFI